MPSQPLQANYHAAPERRKLGGLVTRLTGQPGQLYLPPGSGRVPGVTARSREMKGGGHEKGG